MSVMTMLLFVLPVDYTRYSESTPFLPLLARFMFVAPMAPGFAVYFAWLAEVTRFRNMGLWR